MKNNNNDKQEEYFEPEEEGENKNIEEKVDNDVNNENTNENKDKNELNNKISELIKVFSKEGKNIDEFLSELKGSSIDLKVDTLLNLFENKNINLNEDEKKELIDKFKKSDSEEEDLIDFNKLTNYFHDVEAEKV